MVIKWWLNGTYCLLDVADVAGQFTLPAASGKINLTEIEMHDRTAKQQGNKATR